MTVPSVACGACEQTVPPAIVPPDRAPGLISLLRALLRNPLRALSADHYHEPILVHSGLGGTTVFVMAPELIGEVFHDPSKSFAKNPLDRRIMARLLGNGIIVAPDEDWRWQRRIVAPMFTPTALAHTVPIIADAANTVLERWSAASEGTVRDIGCAMVDLTFDIIQRTMLSDGRDIDANVIKQAIGQYLSPIKWEIAYDFLGIPSWAPHSGSRQMDRAARIARAEIAALVRTRRQSGKPGKDLLGRLILAKDGESSALVSDEQIVDNLLTFLTAGHETTARALTWSLYLAASMPQWQDRLVREIMDVAGSEEITVGQVDQLFHMRRFIQEAMRLFPSAPVISRITRRPVKLGGYSLPGGARILVPIYVVHRHRRLWDRPDTFDPNRFTEEAQAARPRYSYMPFGAGPRVCIGASFAMIEAIVILATLIRGARFETVGPDAPEPVSGITLYPRKPLELKIKPIGSTAELQDDFTTHLSGTAA